MTGALRIAVDANVLNASWGGIPKYLDRIARGLVAGGDRVDLVSNTRRPIKAIPGAHPVPIWVKSRALWRDLVVPAWAFAARPDVFWAPGTWLPRRLSVPMVATVHDLAPLLFPGSKPQWVESEFRTIVARSVRRATRVIAVSQPTARDVERLWGVPAERIHVIPNGVDDALRPGDRSAAAAEVRRRWGIDGPFVLNVGSQEPRKGLDVLIEAAAEAARLGADWRLVLVGTPGYRGEEVVQKARRAGSVLLTGVSDAELAPLYRAAEALAAPSLYEGFGITPLEAMACGTPVVIAAGSGGLEETSASAAIVVRERSARAWIDGVRAAKEQRSALVARGLAHANAFRWPGIALRTRKVLAAAAEEGSRRRQPVFSRSSSPISRGSNARSKRSRSG
jgi:glycosyltransferase involved in cell wall biosynthesis